MKLSMAGRTISLLVFVYAVGVSQSSASLAESVQPGEIIFTEVMPKVEGNDGGWFELFNTTQ